MRFIPSRELRKTMTDGPVLFRGFNNVHEHVLRTQARVFAQQLGCALEERLLLFERARVEHGDLDVSEIIAPRDAEDIAVAEVRRVMFGQGDELVVLGHAERFAHRTIEVVEDCSPIGFGLSGAQRDMNERHRGSFPFRSGSTLGSVVVFWHGIDIDFRDNVWK